MIIFLGNSRVTKEFYQGYIQNLFPIIICYLGPNERALQYRFDIPALPGRFVGTGDVFISLLLVWMDKLNGDIAAAIQNVISTLQGILRRTANKAYCKILM